MPSKIYSCALRGIEAYGVEIEVDILNGLPRLMVVGLGDTAIQESKERVRSAIVNSNAQFPSRRKIINLAPADTRKHGPSFDLPIAVGLLVESGQLPAESVQGALFVGELSLNGSLKPVNGALSYAFFAKTHGFHSLYLPEDNLDEALLISGVQIIALSNLQQLIAHLSGKNHLKVHLQAVDSKKPYPHSTSTLFSHLPLHGDPKAIQALSISAAGSHHLLLWGPPGSGKTLLAHQLPSLLPPLAEAECLELTQVYSAAGLLSSHRPLIQQRPFRSIHHTASSVALVGGGSTVRPGEISLAHRGVLFLDEIPEFPRSLLETLRQPLEQKRITLARASGTVTFPSHFTLVAAMNPCPCGYAGDDRKSCRCTPQEQRRYTQKLSGPLLDRIDLFLEMPRLSFDDFYDAPTAKDRSKTYEKILRARLRQQQRFGDTLKLNTDMTPTDIKTWCALSDPLQALLKEAAERLGLSARATHRILKVARTLADMEDLQDIRETQLLKALQYRSGIGFSP